MKVIVFGTGPFAVPTFTALLKSSHDVPLLVTRPVSDSGKRRKSSDNPTRDAGVEAGIEIYDPPDVNHPDAIGRIGALMPDLLMVCDYGQILSNDCLAIARLGGINLHGSLLPKYRGAAPINWAIYHGETTLGVTVIHMSSKLDAGNCLTKAELRLADDETAADVEPRLAALGVSPVLEAIDLLGQWDGQSPLGEPQDPSLATKAPRLKKQNGLIDWRRSASDICRQIRAFQPWPGSFTHWSPAEKEPLRLIVHRAEPVDQPSTWEPGQVAVGDRQQLLIQTGDGLLSISQLQPAGKKPMPVADFLRGYQPNPGDRFA